MAFIQYPAAKAAIDKVVDYNTDQITAFNTIMTRVMDYANQGQSKIEVLEVHAFEFYSLSSLFVAQGYTVTQIGTNPTIRYDISWS
jgi:hypothetical protein